MTRHVLNRKLVLEAPVRLADGAGGFAESWQVRGTLWAAIQPRGARLGSSAAGALSIAGFRIVVRATPFGHPSRPEPGHRLRSGARAFRIEAVTEEEPAGLYLLCEAQEEMAP
ncbi:head-tail adaptor protein [Thalassococcus sp. CAU 1522]|uniref:Head-tail adaptor protein n=1 Tax=Thalassococcus arenae TaxID=2851652 RepID=A0ABS6NBF1_9RHOB|nr:head-tail adaptor protein [Thalassococcus arenae]MBV2361328.1 head-tail adaptor protein [Thalassococcus arenae]